MAALVKGLDTLGRINSARNIERAAEATAPLLEKEKKKTEKPDELHVVDLLWQYLPVVFLGLGVCAISAAMINMNKYLVQPGRFPFPAVLVLCHCVACTTFGLTLLLLRPKMFPALTDPVRKVTIDKDFMVRRVLPIAVFFSLCLVLGNTAYKYCSVSLLQMMKESNIVTVYLISVTVGLEALNFRASAIILGIFAATVMTVEGELNFSLAGFLVQASCCMAESIKNVIQGILLSGSGKKLDALSYVLIVMPCCGMFLCLFMMSHVAFVGFSSPILAIPAWSDFTKLGMLLPINCCLAFSLNCMIAMFMGYSSPISFMIVMIFKDIVIVVVSCVLIGETISMMQIAGFSLQLVLIFLWSFLKMQENQPPSVEEKAASKSQDV